MKIINIICKDTKYIILWHTNCLFYKIWAYISLMLVLFKIVWYFLTNILLLINIIGMLIYCAQNIQNIFVNLKTI